MQPATLQYRNPTAPCWEVPPNVTDHSERQLPPDRIFIQPPPAEIGEIVSAHSTLTMGKGPISPAVRMGILATCIATPLLAAAAIAPKLRLNEMPFIVILGILVAAGAGAAAAYYTRSALTHTWIGREGVCRYTITSLSSPPRMEALIFASAAELRTAQTRHFVNGGYTGTTYSFVWTAPTGQIVLRLTGRHRGEDGPLKSDDPYHFASASEIAWCNYQLAGMSAALERDGYLQFNIKGSDFVRIGPGFLEFCFGNTVDRVNIDDIATLSLAKGVFSIKHKDAKWFSRAGKWTFQYGTISNARLFVYAIDKLLGYRFK